MWAPKHSVAESQGQWENQPELGESDLTNTGNSIELLNYRIRSGDNPLENHLRSAQQNSKYTSPEIKNDLISSFMDLAVEKLVAEVKESKYYTTLADEATDRSLSGQIALIFRFVDKSSTIREKCLFFLECSYGLSGQSLFKTIKEFLDSNGIDISVRSGQGYDGAGDVTGKNQGLAAHVPRINSKALCTHCSCHRLNLAVVGLLWRTTTQNMMTNTKEICYFF